MPASVHSKTKCVANSSPATHQTPRQQGETGEDSHIHLADWNLSVAMQRSKRREASSFNISAQPWSDHKLKLLLKFLQR